MQLLDKIIVVSSRLVELLFHLIVIDLQGAQLELKLVSLQFSHSKIALQFLDHSFTLPVDFVEADHLTLI